MTDGRSRVRGVALLGSGLLVQACVAGVRDDFRPIPGVYGTAPFSAFIAEPLACDASSPIDFPFAPHVETEVTIDGVEIRAAVTRVPAEPNLSVSVRLRARPGVCRGTVDAAPWISAEYGGPETRGQQMGRQMSCLPQVVWLNGDEELIRSREIPLQQDGHRLTRLTIGLAELESASRGQVRAPAIAVASLSWHVEELEHIVIDGTTVADWGGARPGWYVTGDASGRCPEPAP